MHRFQSLVVKNMDNKQLYENGIKKAPKAYSIIKMFAPSAFVGSGSSEVVHDQRGKHNDMYILEKFYARFPELRLMP